MSTLRSSTLQFQLNDCVEAIKVSVKLWKATITTTYSLEYGKVLQTLTWLLSEYDLGI